MRKIIQISNSKVVFKRLQHSVTQYTDIPASVSHRTIAGASTITLSLIINV